MSDQRQSSRTGQIVDDAGYRRLTGRFDRLWQTAPSARIQHEMQRLLALIEQYEAMQEVGLALQDNPTSFSLSARPDRQRFITTQEKSS